MPFGIFLVLVHFGVHCFLKRGRTLPCYIYIILNYKIDLVLNMATCLSIQTVVQTLLGWRTSQSHNIKSSIISILNFHYSVCWRFKFAKTLANILFLSLLYWAQQANEVGSVLDKTEYSVQFSSPSVGAPAAATSASRLGSKPAPKASAESPKAAPPACACEPTR